MVVVARNDNQYLNPPLPWPPRSPELTPWGFFLCGYIKGRVFVPPFHCPYPLVIMSTRFVVWSPLTLVPQLTKNKTFTHIDVTLFIQ